MFFIFSTKTCLCREILWAWDGNLQICSSHLQASPRAWYHEHIHYYKAALREGSVIQLWKKSKFFSKAPDLSFKIYFSKLFSWKTIEWAFLMISDTDDKQHISSWCILIQSHRSKMIPLENSKSLSLILPSLSLVWQ